MKISSTLIAICLLSSTQIFARTSLALKQGTMELGGSVQLPITVKKGGNTTVGLHLAPAWDYFLTRSFSLGLSPSVERENLTAKNAAWKFSLTALTKYHVHLGGTLYPYLGAGVGVAFEDQKKGVNFLIKAPIGMLVAINNRVAIDFGVPVTLAFNDDGFMETYLPVGYLGVHAFF